MGEKLGKGLEAIFGGNVEELFTEIQNGNVEGTSTSGIKQLDVNEIKANPYQPRKEFDDEALKELADSIKTHGVFNPIIVVKDVKGYILVMGERRLRATKLAGLDKIPACVVEYDDKQMMELSLLENTQREDLNIIEVAEAYQKLIEKFDYTQEALAKRVGKSREYVTNTLRLLRLPKEIQEFVIKGELKNGHVRAILSLDDEEQQILVAKDAIKNNLSVRKVEELVKKLKEGVKPKEKVVKENKYSYVANSMQSFLGTKVSIDNKTIKISFDGTEDLNRILELLNCLDEE